MTTVALCVMVKDEAAIISRLINSAAPHVTRVVCLDTGSTDGTPETVASACDALGLRCDIWQTPWTNFAECRNRLLEVAQGAADYLLLLDADEELEAGASFGELTADAYNLRYAGDLDYVATLLVQGDTRWEYRGATHEYIQAVDREVTIEELPGVKVIHHQDGSSRAVKWQRDLDLLMESWKQEEDPRTAFYLGQTLQDMGDDDGAHLWYGIRADMGGFEEERWLAQVRAAVIWKDTEALLACYDERPWRAEPLYHLAKLHRDVGGHHSALMFAEWGADIAYPSQDILFIERWVYDWGLHMERSVALWWVGHKKEARTITKGLLESAERLNIPAHVVEQLQKDLEF